MAGGTWVATRLSLAVVMVCSIILTIRSRGTLTYVSQRASSTHAASSYSSEAAALREARVKASAQGALPPWPPPTTTHAPPPPPIGSRSAREWSTQRGLGVGWKRTLPPEVAASAVWFKHERTLPQLFDDVGEGEVVWLTFANSAFKDFTINWAAHVYRLRKERAAAIAALDMPLQTALLAEGLPFFGYDHGRTSDLRGDVVEFRRLGALKGELVLKVLRAGRHVLLSDVDTVWLVDPTPTLRALAKDADVMSATDCLSVSGDEAKLPERTKGVNRCAYNPGNSVGHAAFNTGVVYLRSSTAAKAFAAAWRSRLLSVEKSAWLDDQLAFNELVWHGFRNHKSGAVRAKSRDGKVISVQMDPPVAAWKAGWAELMRNRSVAFDPAVAMPADGLSMPGEFALAPLPARHFCSGHLYWEQQGMEARDCYSVHTTFVEGGNLGKLWRMRESALWLLDPPEHYAAPAGETRRYLTYEPPQPPKLLAPTRNLSHSLDFTDKYKAGWLVPDALNLSPRLRQHLELIRRHIVALRDAMAIAFVTGRVLVLPRIPCLCDRSEGPNVIRSCAYEASELPFPFICPLTHLFDIARFQHIRTRPAYMGRIDFRESSFLQNPLTPPEVRDGQRTVHIASDAAAVRAASQGSNDGGGARIWLFNGSSDAQVGAALAPYAHVPVLRLASAEGVFGGWTDANQRALFESVVSHSSILTGSWCCSSWYKPSGSINYATPLPTPVLPTGCGAAGAASGGAPEPNAPEPLRQLCASAQESRVASQRPFELVYAPALGKEGVDGYYRLVSGTGDRFGQLVSNFAAI